jgi:4-hydroxy-2-oxoheptanedioate aldolase
MATVAELKSRLRAGETLTAINLEGANPDIVDGLARFGADLAFVDCERTGLGIDGATELLRATRAARLPSVVRSWSPDPAVLVQFLDRKADGIVVPHIETPADAAAVVRTVQFACGAAAGERLVIVQIESRAGVEQIDKIAAVDGVDVFLIGPNDLAYSLTGVRGAQSPEVEAAIDHICARLKFAGQRFGMPMQLRDVDVFRRRGATFVYYSANWLLQSGMMELNRAIGR